MAWVRVNFKRNDRLHAVQILPPCNYCNNHWCIGDKFYRKALLRPPMGVPNGILTTWYKPLFILKPVSISIKAITWGLRHNILPPVVALIVFSCNGMSMASWNEIFNYWDTKLSFKGIWDPERWPDRLDMLEGQNDDPFIFYNPLLHISFLLQTYPCLPNVIKSMAYCISCN